MGREEENSFERFYLRREVQQMWTSTWFNIERGPCPVSLQPSCPPTPVSGQSELETLIGSRKNQVRQPGWPSFSQETRLNVCRLPQLVCCDRWTGLHSPKSTLIPPQGGEWRCKEGSDRQCISRKKRAPARRNGKVQFIEAYEPPNKSQRHQKSLSS